MGFRLQLGGEAPVVLEEHHERLEQTRGHPLAQVVAPARHQAGAALGVDLVRVSVSVSVRVRVRVRIRVRVRFRVRIRDKVRVRVRVRD